MTKKIGTGQLFEQSARTVFLNLTRTRYDSMLDRLERKGLPLPKFTRDQFREFVLWALRGNVDGFLKCRYCSAFFTFADCAVDHEVPLSRGGSVELDNIGFPCSPCNSRKGSMTPDEFLKLSAFLEAGIPLAQQDVLSRLEKANALAAGARNNAGIISELRKSGEWAKARAARNGKRKGGK